MNNLSSRYGSFFALYKHDWVKQSVRNTSNILYTTIASRSVFIAIDFLIPYW